MHSGKHIRHRNEKLDNLFLAIRPMLDRGKTTRVAELIEEIEQDHHYRNLWSTGQRIHFFLLKIYYHLKKKEQSKALDLFDGEIAPYALDGQNGANVQYFPDDFKELFYYISALVYYYKKDFQASNHYFLKQLDYTKTEESLAKSYYNIALSYHQLHDIPKALEYGQKAVDMWVLRHSWLEVADVYTVMGVLCWEDERCEEAIAYLQKALAITERFDYLYLKVKILHNLGLVYQSMQQMHESLTYLHQSLTTKKQLKDKPDIDTYHAILDIYDQLNDVESMKRIYNEVHERRTQLKKEEHYTFRIMAAKIYYALGNKQKYEQLMAESIHYFYTHKMYKTLFSEQLVEKFRKYFEEQDNHEKARYYSQIELNLKQQIQEEEHV